MTKPNYIDWPGEEKKKLARSLAHDQIHKIWPPEANYFSDMVQGYFQGFSDGFLKALNLVEASTHADR